MPLEAQSSDAGAFVMLQGNDTVAVEHFTRSPTRLQGSIADWMRGAVATYSGALSPDGLVPHMELEFGAMGGSEPLQRASMTFTRDSALIEVTIATGTTRRRVEAAGAIPFVNPSFALFEQVLQRARVLGGETARVPLLIAGQPRPVPTLVSRPGGDSAVIMMGSLQIHIRTDEMWRIIQASIPAQGIWVVRADPSALPRAAAPPDYSAPAGAPYASEDVVIPSSDGHYLAGTLTMPQFLSGPAPAVVLISGSGPQDRDSALLPRYRPFRQIADELSRRGIAVLRLDDRGWGASSGSFAGTTTQGFARDVQAAVHYLRGRSDIDVDAIALAGHSEGGIVAQIVAASDPGISAVALLATPASNIMTVLEWQREHVMARDTMLTMEQRDSALAAMRAVAVEAARAEPWLRWLADLDPSDLARQVRPPVLIVQGGTDTQVRPAEAERLAGEFRMGGNPDVTVRVIPGVNHLLLRDDSGDFLRYHQLRSRDVATEVLFALGEWFEQRLR